MTMMWHYMLTDDTQTKLLDKYKHLWRDGKVDKNVIAQILKVIIMWLNKASLGTWVASSCSAMQTAMFGTRYL